ncbi:hypothetical protein COEREDRAFT_92960 [Coemansia reversa NRRL 1564]|uniref:Velvet domain-containing protein n=1 Tax=Coemansia reversa (strain ATCC 12441 / NRRL 1564) TaxID=763665 RepID=A0A2G5BAE5_COERN|nr:hypothetical protein COEREDRAFT_92960 [Coemansia reversa NRRL 1564]|eukprot:PIA15983.1 hypothetical protein COEREDRAFT_92960 [Coemansia reversa NRRL 1564]
MTTLPTSQYSTGSSSSGSGSRRTSISSDLDNSRKIYRGSVQSPSNGVVNTPLDPVTVILECLNANGDSIKLKDGDAQGLVVYMGLASEDGTIDVDPSPKGERILIESSIGTPNVVKNQLVTEFKMFKICRPGRYRFHARVFNIYDTVPHLSSQINNIGRTPSDSLFNGLSCIVTINESKPISQ